MMKYSEPNKGKFPGRRILTAAALFLPLIVLSDPVAAAPKSRLNFGLKYGSFYDSNIFHSHLDFLETGTQLNNIAADLEWKYRQSRKLLHALKLYGDFDLYAGYGGRNKNTFGAAYAPSIYYGRIGRFETTVDYSRRDKDLYNDAGEIQARTLKKGILTLSGQNRLKLGRWQFNQKFEYGNYNYDDYYLNGIRQLSYDYYNELWDFSAERSFFNRLELKYKFSTEKRFYDERKTLALNRFSSQVRNFREINSAISANIHFHLNNALSLSTEYFRRTDNYQDFYGFRGWEHKAELKIYPGRRHETEISFGYRTKDYPNYSGSIGTLNRVWIEYATLTMQDRLILSDALSLIAYLRNFNKVSNDPNYDYHELTAGIAIEVAWK